MFSFQFAECLVKRKELSASFEADEISKYRKTVAETILDCGGT